MNEQNGMHRQALSAMADGELTGVELAQVLDAMRSDDEGLATWHCYHLVGEVMRGDALLDAGRDAAFLRRLRGSLQREAPVPSGAAVALDRSMSLDTPGQTPRIANRTSANDAHFTWRWVAGVAAIGVAATVGWMTVHGTSGSTVRPVLAQLPELAAPASPASAAALAEAVVSSPRMLRDPKLDQWMAAHRQVGGASALQMPAGFVRNATLEGVER